MSENNENHNLNRKIPLLLVLIFICIVILSFLYGLIQLILEPANVFAVEERKNISRRDYISDI